MNRQGVVPVRGDVSFVASLIYAAMVILGISMIAGGVLSIFQPGSTFESEASSFTRWAESIRSGDPYTITIQEDEGFVLGYRRDCIDMFSRLDAHCSDDELCLCLARSTEDDREEVRCVGTYVSMSVEARDPVNGEAASIVPGGCASSHAPSIWRTLTLRSNDNDRTGIYIFEPNAEESTIVVSVRG